MNWAKVLHYGVFAVMLVDGALSYLGVHIPGVTVDTSTVFTTAGAWFVGGHVGKASA